MEPNLTEAEKGYIAGIIDGEGYIGLYLHPKDGKWPTYDVTLVVDMTDKEVMEWLHKRIGGSFYVSPPRAPRKYRISYRVTLWANQAALLLKVVRPYLIVKAEKADRAIRLQTMRTQKPVSRVPIEIQKAIAEGRM